VVEIILEYMDAFALLINPRLPNAV
jgi:hypothetical protein